MQNKWIRTPIFSIIIIVIIALGMGNFRRFKADMYFDRARKVIHSYALRGEGMKYIQWAYWEAIRLNPLEFYNYEHLLNKTYMQVIQEEVRK